MRCSVAYNWIDTSKAGKTAFDHPRPNHGKDNPYECRVILALLRTLSTDTECLHKITQDVSAEDKPIGIICSYSEQKSLLQKLLSEQEWAVGLSDLIKIDTVDSYQGKENRIIILSLTRNNERYEQGFLSSPERINVSISRAMERLIIVGATRMWTQANTSAPLGQVYSFMKSRADEQDYAIVDASVVMGGVR